LQSLSGIAAATGTADDPPTPVGASVVDQHGAVLGAFGILAALHGRERTGRGARVESNLLSAALDLQIEPLSYFLNGYTGRRSGSGVSSPYYKAPYGVFATADGHLTLSLNALTVLAAVFEDDWFLGIGEDSSYGRREDVNERVAKHMAQRTTEDWSAVFAAAGVWFAPVNTYADIVADPQVLHNKSVIEIDHPRAGAVKLLGHPISYDGQRPGVRSMPPELGSSNRTVLAELGFSATEIDRLQAKVGK
jgi:crotonobetainyl-CoA:carnitine CoA-transferase CaiB-like acyl-CoA transferase